MQALIVVRPIVGCAALDKPEDTESAVAQAPTVAMKNMGPGRRILVRIGPWYIDSLQNDMWYNCGVAYVWTLLLLFLCLGNSLRVSAYSKVLEIMYLYVEAHLVI